jgi:hypothetical protein
LGRNSCLIWIEKTLFLFCTHNIFQLFIWWRNSQLLNYSFIELVDNPKQLDFFSIISIRRRLFGGNQILVFAPILRISTFYTIFRLHMVFGTELWEVLSIKVSCAVLLFHSYSCLSLCWFQSFHKATLISRHFWRRSNLKKDTYFDAIWHWLDILLITDELTLLIHKCSHLSKLLKRHAFGGQISVIQLRIISAQSQIIFLEFVVTKTPLSGQPQHPRPISWEHFKKP